MKIKFNKFERVAGLFVLTAILGGIAATVGIAVKKGWFEPKVAFQTKLQSADGVREGTHVQIAGLKAGNVTEVELRADNEVVVKFEVSRKFHQHVRGDSVVRVVRPFVIGDKVLEVSVGREAVPQLQAYAQLPSEPSYDIMDLVSGRTLGPYLQTIGKMMENLRFVAEALLDPERSRAMVQMFDEIRPMMKHLGIMSKEASGLLQALNKKQKLVRSIDNLVAITDEVNKLLPLMVKDAPQLAADLAKISHNMAILTDEVNKTLPMMQAMAPEVPRVSKRAMEALDETVVTLKALQRSFVLRGSVKDVRDEESGRDRLPASTTDKADKKQ